ncbi:MAG: FtsX-like permease family protein [Rhodothermaceae bacterium]|nr:FtsX-like permease family protein [Rhodothermaceae bacterium]
MLKNYLTIALRTLRKQKLYSVINVFGLALGIACCVLLLLFVADELTFDTMHTEDDRIVRISRISLTEDGQPDGEPATPYMPIPAGPALVEDIPEVEAAVRLKRFRKLVRHGELTVEDPVVFADPAILTVFTFPLRAGDPATALSQSGSVVLSEAAAQRYFGEEDPMGQTLEVQFEGEFEPFTVTGVAAVESNSTVNFEVLLPFERIYDAHPWMISRADAFTWSSTITYVQLREDASLAAVEAKVPAFLETHYGPHVDAMRESGFWTSDTLPLDYFLQPLADIHLNPDVRPGLTPPSNPLYAKILAAIALAVLLIACINFMTLAIGRSAARAKEVGVRKTIGARRGQLLRQFWGEAFLMTVLGLGLGLVLAVLFVPAFNGLTGKELSLGLVNPAWAAGALAGITLLTGLVAGSYPALMLSRLKPIETLKDRVRLGGANVFTRSLVVVQFALSVFLLVGALIMSGQLAYLQTRDLGFEDDNVAVIDVGDLHGDQVLERYRTALAGEASLRGFTGTSIAFGHGTSSVGFPYKGRDVEVVEYRVAADFVERMRMELLAGRDFNPLLASDSTDAVLINEALAREFGWADPLGQVVEGFRGEGEGPTVIGVVRDFNFRSQHLAVEPAVLTLDPNQTIEYVLARIVPGHTPEALAALEASWAEFAPDLPFSYSFLDEDLAAFYENEARWAEIVRYATLFALLVACLGLFGLASLAVAQRTKEIGIRKVLGASVGSIAALLAKGFAGLVAVSGLIAAPLAYLAGQRWLEGFAYRIDLGPGVFLLAGGLALLVALLTVSAQALRAATADPVQSLRYE